MSNPDGDRTFLVIGDIHGATTRLAAVVGAANVAIPTPPTAVLLTGDLSTPNLPVLDGLLQALDALAPLAAPVFCVPGNHDSRRLDHSANIDHRQVRVDGVTIAGLGGAGPARLGFPYEWDDKEVIRDPPPAADVLLTHAPPRGTTLDVLRGGGQHVGSDAVRLLAKHYRLLVCGHVHEAVGVTVLGHTACYNVGALGEPFGAAQYGVDFPACPRAPEGALVRPIPSRNSVLRHGGNQVAPA